MSITQTFVGTALGAGLIFAASNFALKAVLPLPVPITVHALTYANGMVTVDRTIDSDQPYFAARKVGQVINTKTGSAEPQCDGTKFANFTAGQRSDTVPLAQWSGNADCTPESLAPGEYQLVAVYSWGDQQLAVVGKPFTITAPQ